MRSRVITSFYNGRCRVCGRAVPKGQSVYFIKHYGVRCMECGPHTDSDERLPSRKTTKRAPRRPRPEPLHRQVEPAPVAAGPAEYVHVNGILRNAVEADADGVTRMVWDSVSEIVEDSFSPYAQSPDAVEYLAGIQARSNTTWTNGHSAESLRRLVQTPDPALIEAIEQMRQELGGELDLPATQRRKVRRGLDWGEELDADRWLVRDPSAWERSIREQCPSRTVTIAVNLTVSWSQQPEELLYRGAAACALADLLSGQGVNVRIVGFSVGEDCSSEAKKTVSLIELKAADMPLDVASIATAACEVAFYRLVVMPGEFRHLRGRVSHSLGMRGSQVLPPADRLGIDYLVESGVNSREAAVEWLRGQLQSETEVSHV